MIEPFIPEREQALTTVKTASEDLLGKELCDYICYGWCRLAWMINPTVFDEIIVPIEDPMAHRARPFFAEVMEFHHVRLAVSFLPEVRQWASELVVIRAEVEAGGRDGGRLRHQSCGGRETCICV